jgi:ribosomal protein L11 methylase PrmA
MPATQLHPSSYRDPSGFLFYKDGTLYRQVNKSFAADFELFNSSGLYNELAAKELIVRHAVIQENLTQSAEWHTTIQPEFIPFISYPYEWCFDMLKEGALLTLEANRAAIQKGMILKDASAYNVQWHQGRMRFIDSLSFEKYDETKPWIAYRQFCEQFLAPLALMHFLKLPLHPLFMAWPEGIPVHIASKMLPFKSKLHLHSFLNLHLQSSVSSGNSSQKKPASFTRNKMLNLLRSLEEAVRHYQLSMPTGVWSGYYLEARERADYVDRKKEIIESWLSHHNFKTAIDIGANEGIFSFILSNKAIETVSADFDHYSVNRLLSEVKLKDVKNILPLCMDFSNPSSATGVNNEEHASFLSRTDFDLALGLAVIHHLAIGKNIPFDKIAKLFHQAGNTIFIEFVPKTDEKIQLMLQQKKDVYSWYNEESFVQAFQQLFETERRELIGNSGRILYRMKRR